MQKHNFETPVKASNEIVLAKYKYTSLEIDVMFHIMRMINNVKGEVNQYSQYTLPFDLITESFGDTGRSIEYLRNSFKGIQTKPLEFWDNLNARHVILNLIQRADIYPSRRTVVIFMDMFMVDHLRNLKKEFTSFELKSILAMDSVYAKRIYMMLCQFRSTGFMKIEMDALRLRLCLGDKYSMFKDFRKRVIDTAIKEINALSEITVEVSFSRGGRAVDELHFMFKHKQNVADLVGNDQQIKAMIHWGLSDWQIDNVLMTLKPNDIHEVLKTMDQRLKDRTKQAITNRGAYLVSLFNSAGVNLTKQLPKQMSIV